MAKIVTIINFKGGVGKTTTAVEISVSLTKYFGRRTLLVDLDPQASATFYLMEQERWKQWKDSNGTTYNVFEQTNRRFCIREAIVTDVIQGKAPIFGFDLLPFSETYPFMDKPSSVFGSCFNEGSFRGPPPQARIGSCQAGA
jgi:chromosome partitioning protein